MKHEGRARRRPPGRRPRRSAPFTSRLRSSPTAGSAVAHRRRDTAAEALFASPSRSRRCPRSRQPYGRRRVRGRPPRYSRSWSRSVDDLGSALPLPWGPTRRERLHGRRRAPWSRPPALRNPRNAVTSRWIRVGLAIETTRNAPIGEVGAHPSGEIVPGRALWGPRCPLLCFCLDRRAAEQPDRRGKQGPRGPPWAEVSCARPLRRRSERRISGPD
jgi:hypothetical protein